LLASGQINANTLVWTDGMPNWIAAIGHPDLAVAAQQQQQHQMHVQPGYAPGQPLQYYGPSNDVQYAGFWLRFGAALLDGLITGVAGCIVGGIAGFAYAVSTGGAPGQGGSGANVGFQLFTNLLGVAIGWLYSALMESSSAQATLGKMACGIKVTDLNGNRISFGRATGRHFGKIISGIILLIGYMMAGWTEK
jgi:uncharacterized RDD family membrane protein YckC